MTNTTEYPHDGKFYRLCSATEALPAGSVVYAFTVPPTHWDMFTRLLRGVVHTEHKGAIGVKWDDGIWGTLKKEYVCVLCPRE